MHRCGQPVDGAYPRTATVGGDRVEAARDAREHDVAARRPPDARGDGSRGGRATVTDPVDYAAVWTAAMNDLSDDMVSAQKRAYLRLTVLRGIFDDTALLAVPDAFTRDVIESQLRTIITEALSRHLGRSVQVAVTVRSTVDGTRNALTDPTVAVAVVPVPKAKPPIPDSRHEPDLDDTSGPESGPGRALSGRIGIHREDRTRNPADAGNRLNPKYTFETFVIGSSNRFAHAAAVAAARDSARPTCCTPSVITPPR
jgi:chromosomal replication initiator protein